MRTGQLAWIATALVAALTASTVIAGDPPGDDPAETVAPPPPPSPEAIADARVAFGDVARVLLSPRCRNCHPSGDAPLQTDAGRPHKMNVSRVSFQSGLTCSTCHQERNSEAVGVPGGPPGAPHWQLPPGDVPMRFEDHTPATLCEQLKDPARNKERSLDDLLHHVGHDPLVLWAWDPGGERTKPPMSHERFVAAFDRWVAGAGACPEPTP